MYVLDQRNSNGVDRGSRRASSRGIIPRAKVKTVKMTIVIVIGKKKIVDTPLKDEAWLFNY